MTGVLQNTEPRPKAIYSGVQALRGFAAFIVLLHHDALGMTYRIGERHWSFVAGQAGVDVFFLQLVALS